MRITCAFLLIPLFIISGSLPIYALDDKIIAVVNDDVITLGDLHDYLSAVYMGLASSGKSEDEIRELMKTYQTDGINKLIERKLLVDEANLKGLIINEKIIEERLQDIENYYGSDANFRTALSKDGVTITDLINTITDQLKAQSIIDMEVKSKIFVNPQEVTDYYQEHKEQFLKPERVDLQSILIPYGDNKTRANQQAIEALKLIDTDGANFDDIAQRYSKAPSIGIIARGQFLSKIETIVFNLKKGEISQPLETEAEIYIFRVKAKYPAQQASLEEVRDTVSNIIFNQKFQQRVTAWLEELKSRAYIEIKG